jgi:hypothetical protein
MPLTSFQKNTAHPGFPLGFELYTDPLCGQD